MLYNRTPHVIGFDQEPERKFCLFADELEALADLAAKSNKKEMAAILQRLAQYGRAKAQRGNGPTRFIYR